MTWLKVDDRMPDHPKIVGLAAATKWALVEIWCYCAAHQTDGHIPDGAVKKIATRRNLDELADAGLIDRNGTGWIVHDWLDHNVSSADHKARREADAERLRKWRDKRKRNGDGNDV